MKMMPSSPYRDLLTRRRWPLHVGYWMLIGVYVESKEERKQHIDTIKDQKLKARLDIELKKLDDLDKEQIALHEDWDTLTNWQKVKRILKRRREEKRSPITDEMLDWLHAYHSVTTTRYIRVEDWVELEECFTEDGEVIKNELWERLRPYEQIDFSKRFGDTAEEPVHTHWTVTIVGAISGPMVGQKPASKP